MKALNTFIRVILMIGLSYTITACDKKSDSQPNFARNNRNAINDRNIIGNNPRDPRNAGNVGYIYNFNMNSLYDFLGLSGAQGELGYVSSQLNDRTGVFLTGDISEDGRSGRINIMVWDEEAERTGQAYQVQLDVVNGNVDNQGADITLQDDFGTVRFSGSWNTSRGTWEGTVTYDNGRTLGSFITGECSPVRCP